MHYALSGLSEPHTNSKTNLQLNLFFEYPALSLTAQKCCVAKVLWFVKRTEMGVYYHKSAVCCHLLGAFASNQQICIVKPPHGDDTRCLTLKL